jgi:hypothetical protein
MNVSADQHIPQREMIVGTAALALPASSVAPSISSLWADRPALVERLDHANDLAETVPGYQPDQELMRVSSAANLALWELDERIMSMPARSLQDLSIKAHVNKLRTDADGPYEPFVTRLLDDIILLASNS